MSLLAADASVVVKLLLPEDHTAEALAHFSDAATAGDRIIAPTVLPTEITNALRRTMRRERLSLTIAATRLDDFLALPIALLGWPDVFRRALALTEAHSLSAFDAQCVALAELMGCDLWVADERLLRALGGRRRFVRWIGNYPRQRPTT